MTIKGILEFHSLFEPIKIHIEESAFTIINVDGTEIHTEISEVNLWDFYEKLFKHLILFTGNVAEIKWYVGYC
jgi:hypothetical protein